MENIILKKVTISESKLLQKIAIETFTETFGEDNNQDDMNDYVATKLTLNQLESELLNPNSFFYFAQKENEILGYLKLNTKSAQTEDQGNDALEIERIYVKKEFHGLKVGQFLFNESLNFAKEIKVKRIWLGVWEENKRAIKFYEKNGFTVFDKHIFVLGNDEQTDYLMEKYLI